MYLPAKFMPEDVARQIQLMRESPFATFITFDEGRPHINHFPILTEKRDGKIFLLGHMARSNPQWETFASSEVTVVFHGPHTYVTPSWYRDPMNVPTWNYAVVHATGRGRALETFGEIEAILQKTVGEFERQEKEPWRYELPEEFRRRMVQAIVGFEIEVTQLEGKFKLSQNRTDRDRAGVLDGLATRRDEMSLKVLEMMRQNG